MVEWNQWNISTSRLEQRRLLSYMQLLLVHLISNMRIKVAIEILKDRLEDSVCYSKFSGLL